MNNLVELVKFIQHNKPSTELVFTLISEQDSTGLEIEWLPYENYANWRYREINSSEWIDCSASNLELVASRYQVDSKLLNKDLENIVLKNVKQHYLIIDQVHRLLGEEVTETDPVD